MVNSKRARKKRRNRCVTGKTRFRSHSEAIASLHSLQRSTRDVIPIRSYFCGKCKGWHLSSCEAMGHEQLTLDFSDQPIQLARVKSKVAVAILQFFDSLTVGQEFYAQQLRDYVAAQIPVAPASPDRILRDMRQRGELSYEVVSRSQSLYRKL